MLVWKRRVAARAEHGMRRGDTKEREREREREEWTRMGLLGGCRTLRFRSSSALLRKSMHRMAQKSLSRARHARNKRFAFLAVHCEDILLASFAPLRVNCNVECVNVHLAGLDDARHTVESIKSRVKDIGEQPWRVSEEMHRRFCEGCKLPGSVLSVRA